MHLNFQKTGSDYEFGYHAQSELGVNGVGSRGSHGHLETKVNGETVRFHLILKCYAIKWGENPIFLSYDNPKFLGWIIWSDATWWKGTSCAVYGWWSQRIPSKCFICPQGSQGWNKHSIS